MYGNGPYAWGYSHHPVPDCEEWEESLKDTKTKNLHLRSTQDVSGHHIQAADGEIGHVEDFIIDDKTWAIRYLVIDTQNWWPGKKVLISPKWIERISWSESKVFVNLLRETIKLAPEYTDDYVVTRDYEAGLHRHYNRPGYWLDELAAK
jgi:sporulation protein YlmC with PRC-barrel domain